MVRGVMSERDVLVLAVLSGVFSATIVFANIAAGVKITNFLGLVVPAGTIAYCFTFPITDIVDEVYGKKKAVYIVWAGLAAEVVMLVLVWMDWFLPALEPSMEELYHRVFGLQTRIVAASLIAYVISQHHDVWAFWKWRELTKGRWLWVRNNASTMVSQLIDSAIFTFIAFYGVVPLGDLVVMAASLWLFKVVIALIDTPFVYLGVWLVRKYVRVPRLTGAVAGADVSRLHGRSKLGN
ncbi:MAG: queuosine precursor transporter [Desulfurococcales archaeon]|nr:queuosine precursor transporter [Desulfurococcales archaeon]